jgi:tetratricopeptide (TPR) repeat protein
MPQSAYELIAQADALKAEGQPQAAIALYQTALKREPGNLYFLHNLAATLGDVGQFAESANVARQAIALGLTAPETRLVLARALMNSGDMAGAEQAYRSAIASRPDMAAALYELAQLIWMLSADHELAMAPLRDAATRFPASTDLHQAVAQALTYTGDIAGAARYVQQVAERGLADQALLAWGADMLLETGQLHSGRELAIQAFLADRAAFGPLLTLIRAALACGDADGASAALAEASHRRPLDQHVLALQAMVWRMTGDARFESLYDYRHLVRPYPLDVPDGWATRQHYLADLAAELKSAHPFVTHPFGHSVRQGSQLPNLLSIASPAIQAFRQAIQVPVDRHLQYLGHGTDPLRRRNTGRWSIQGIWSVWLPPGGFHTDHVHQEGWLSSACHIELPAALSSADSAEHKAGWLRFGEAGSPVQPPQPAQHYVQPEPGTLVLFPSYMWHGTVPFGGEQPRLTVALDIVPA